MQLNRRHLLAFGAATLAAPGALHAAEPASEDSKLDTLLTAYLERDFDDDPEWVTSLGLDVGARAAQRFRLGDRSVAALARERAEATARLAQVEKFDRAKLGRSAAISHDIARFRLGIAVERAKFSYGGAAPYVLTQQHGAYQSIPDWLDNQHPIKTKDDASAFLARLNALGTALDQETERTKLDAESGAAAPAFILDKTLKQLAVLRDTHGADSGLSKSVARRAGAAGIEGDFAEPAARLIDQIVRPAAARQYEALQAIRAKAGADAGVWRLPEGAAFYANRLAFSTTTRLSADEIHRIGREQVRDLHARLDPLLKGQGLTKGSVGARIAAFNTDKRYLFANDVAGRAEVLAFLNQKVADMDARLPRAFGRLPKAKVEIRRVPPAIEIGAPNGYYQRPALDGSRPGAFYINLRDTANWPRWGLATLAYHEAAPGHHLQIALTQEAGALPLYRRLGGFSAYTEGWALYAERLAGELGVYENDPAGEIGFLQSFLFRATRLVVDTGLHAKRWSRAKAIAWMVDNAGEPPDSAQSEIDRYCVNPGQACSYKLGEIEISRLRADAEKRLGAKFDLKGFHEAVLGDGFVPLTVLERVVQEWAAAQTA